MQRGAARETAGNLLRCLACLAIDLLPGAALNQIFQGKMDEFGESTERFLANTIFGLLGFFDIAGKAGIPSHDEDFGQTLGRWGVGHGPYLVLPFWGPSSVRDGIGLAADWGLYQWINPFGLAEWESDKRLWMTPLRAIDARDRVAFQYYETGSPFEYEWVRMLYSTKRQLDIEK